jgi:hypothetical protein
MVEKVSGAKLNYQKTAAMKIGEIMVPEWLNATSNIKILGINFEENIKSASEINWRNAVNKLRQLLWLHTARNLNLIQKVILCNTFILLSKVWYIAAIFPISKKMG